MRIPGTKVWRAFPELDRFDDDQCARFVRGARRSRALFTRLLLGLLMLGVTLLVGAGVAVGCFGVVVWVGLNHFGPYDWRGDVRDIVIVIIAGGAGLLSGLLLRDRLLRKRIGWVIAHRGSCMQCRYVLLGLPVDAQLNVICPECGVPTPVDASLGELSTDERGIGRFTPKQESIVKPWLTPEQWRRVLAWAGGIVTALLFAAVCWWGWREVSLRRQVSQAQAERAGAAAYLSLVAQSQPPGVTDNSPNAFDEMDKAAALLRTLEAAVLGTPEGQALSGGQRLWPDYTLIGVADPKDAGENQFARQEREYARLVLEGLPGSGVVEALDAMAKCLRADDSATMVSAKSLGEGLSMRFTPMRALARFNVGRMREAVRTQNLGEFTRALTANFALSRMLYQQPTLISGLVGVPIDSLTLGEVRRVLASRPSREWLDAIERAMTEQAPPVGWVGRMYAGEREVGLDSLRTMFSELAFVRKGEMPASMLSGEPVQGCFGSYQENRGALIQWYDALIAEAAQRPFERTPIPRDALVNGLALGGLLASFGKAHFGTDLVALQREGVKTMIALERFRLATGSCPESLDQLVPTYLASVPIDPWSGRAFGYRRIDLKSDESSWGYLLYSVAGDGRDHGGAQAPPEVFGQVFTDSQYHGFDFVINRVED